MRPPVGQVAEPGALAGGTAPAWLLALIFCGMITGCVVVPSCSRKASFGNRITSSDLSFVRAGVTTCDEFTQRFGPPWTNYAELSVSVYYWETVKYHWAFLSFYPSGGVIVDVPQLHVLVIEFDRDDRVRKQAILKHPGSVTTKELATKWVGGN